MLLFWLSKGWTLTRPTLTPGEWLTLHCIAVAFIFTSISYNFYVGNSPSTFWVIFNVFLYGFIYSNIFYFIFKEIRRTRGFALKISPPLFPDIVTAPIIEKLIIYKRLTNLAILMVVVEAVSNILYANDYISMPALVLGYEVPSWVIFMVLSYVMRPRDYGPFFFMVPWFYFNDGLDQQRNRFVCTYCAFTSTNQLFMVTSCTCCMYTIQMYVYGIGRYLR